MAVNKDDGNGQKNASSAEEVSSSWRASTMRAEPLLSAMPTMQSSENHSPNQVSTAAQTRPPSRSKAPKYGEANSSGRQRRVVSANLNTLPSFPTGSRMLPMANMAYSRLSGINPVFVAVMEDENWSPGLNGSETVGVLHSLSKWPGRLSQVSPPRMARSRPAAPSTFFICFLMGIEYRGTSGIGMATPGPPRGLGAISGFGVVDFSTPRVFTTTRAGVPQDLETSALWDGHHRARMHSERWLAPGWTFPPHAKPTLGVQALKGHLFPISTNLNQKWVPSLFTSDLRFRRWKHTGEAWPDAFGITSCKIFRSLLKRCCASSPMMTLFHGSDQRIAGSTI
jgi:hypothetical protein